jgi:regulator of replication initiation timing
MSAIIETTKVVVELAKKGVTIELQEKIVQLREEALELQEENLKLKTENIALKKKEELQEKVKFNRKVYYREGDEVPFCPYCYEKNQLLIHLKFQNEDIGYNAQFHYCQECMTTYRVVGDGDFTYWEQRKR